MGLIDYDLYKKTYRISENFNKEMTKIGLLWIRELRNRRILDDVMDKEYLRQADETLRSFEMAIQYAQLEVERLTTAKERSRRLSNEKREMDKWEVEKQEADFCYQ